MERIDLNRSWQFCKLPGCSIDDLPAPEAGGDRRNGGPAPHLV